MRKVFISYRRDDTGADAGRLYSDLEREFGRDALFKDVDDVPLGVDVAEVVKGAIQQSAVLLVLIGPNWASPRLDDPDDWVRFEIETALAADVPILPIRFRGAPMPHLSELPATLSSLAGLNAGEVDHHSWERDLGPIRNAIRRWLSRGNVTSVDEAGARVLRDETERWYRERFGPVGATPRTHVLRDVDPDEAGSGDGSLRLVLVPTMGGEISEPFDFAELVPEETVMADLAAHLRAAALEALVEPVARVEPCMYMIASILVRAVPRRRKRDAVGPDVAAALHTYFHPVAGGPAGTGYPFGRSILRGDVFKVAQEVPSVVAVEDVELSLVDFATGDLEPMQRIDLDPGALVFLNAVETVVVDL